MPEGMTELPASPAGRPPQGSWASAEASAGFICIAPLTCSSMPHARSVAPVPTQASDDRLPSPNPSSAKAWVKSSAHVKASWHSLSAIRTFAASCTHAPSREKAAALQQSRLAMMTGLVLEDSLLGAATDPSHRQSGCAPRRRFSLNSGTLKPASRPSPSEPGWLRATD
jgi:hypothetical protein